MKPAPVDYNRISSSQAVPLLGICHKYNTDEPDLALRKAAKDGDVSDVECLLLDYNASLDTKSSNGFTALDWALKNGKLPKQVFLLIYHMQSCDSPAKYLLENSHCFEVADKNSLLAYAIHRKNKTDQALLIDTFQADIYVAREIFMNTTYEDESFENQFMKKCVELSAQEAANAAATATLRGYRIAFCDFLASNLFTTGHNLGITNLIAGLQVSIVSATAKEALALNVISQENIERRLAEENQQMGTMLRLFKPVSMDIAAKSARRALPTKEKIIKNMMVKEADKLSENAAESRHSLPL